LRRQDIKSEHDDLTIGEKMSRRGAAIQLSAFVDFRQANAADSPRNCTGVFYIVIRKLRRFG
jgi:hypothetical protein